MIYHHLKCSLLLLATTTYAICPYSTGQLSKRDADVIPHSSVEAADILAKYVVDDSGQYLTSDVGGPIDDRISLKAGARGPTLLEDFVFRQKIMHFDHERVPERAVHARGAGKHRFDLSCG